MEPNRTTRPLLRVDTAGIEDHGALALETLCRILHATSQASSESELIEEVLRLTILGLNAERGAAMVLAPTGRVQAVVEVRGREPAPEGWLEAGVGCFESVAPIRVEVGGAPAVFLPVTRRGGEPEIVLAFGGAKGGEAFSEDTLELLASVTGQLAEAAHRLRLLEEARSLQGAIVEVREQERQRIGQDLHDGLCQQLIGIKFLAKHLQRALGEVDEERAGEAGRIVDLLGEAAAQARTLARGLCPVAFDDVYGLTVALGQLAEETEQRYATPCTLECSELPAIHDTVRATHLFYIAREAVQNAVQHARAKKIGIDLRESEGRLVVSVSDDGIGLKGAEPGGIGSGVRIMRHRARSIGGVFKLESPEQGGLVVRCSLELDPREPAERLCLTSAMLDRPAILVPGVTYTVGRDRETDVCLRSNKVSRQQAELRWQGENLIVADLGSTNGTLVNGELISGPTVVAAGDRISFGGCEAQVRVAEEGEHHGGTTERMFLDGRVKRRKLL